MNLKRIIPGKWYQTVGGIGKCQGPAGGNTFKFEIDGKVMRITATGVQHEIAKGEEPLEIALQDAADKEYIRETGRRDNREQARRSLAEATVMKPGDHLALLKAAMHALRSYQYGNGSTLLAEEIADAIDVALSNAKGRSS